MKLSQNNSLKSKFAEAIEDHIETHKHYPNLIVGIDEAAAACEKVVLQSQRQKSFNRVQAFIFYALATAVILKAVEYFLN